MEVAIVWQLRLVHGALVCDPSMGSPLFLTLAYVHISTFSSPPADALTLLAVLHPGCLGARTRHVQDSTRRLPDALDVREPAHLAALATPARSDHTSQETRLKRAES